MALAVKRWRCSVGDYIRMHESGILGPDARTELIEGEIIEMPPIGSPHAGTVARLSHYLSRQLGDRAILWGQSPLHLDEWSLPQPDIVLLRMRDDFYTRAHPTPADALLLVEVADSSLSFDRDVKVPLYARAGIPEVWLVALPKGRIEVYRRPAGGAFGSSSRAGPGDRLRPMAFPDVELDAGEILGRT